MCTCVAFRRKSLFFGRNMDLDYNFGEMIVATPRMFGLRSLGSEEHFGFIGVATVIDGYPLYADAMNEKGVAMAGLSFHVGLKYHEINSEKYNIAPFEFIPWVLGQCDDIAYVKQILSAHRLSNAAPFHSRKLFCQLPDIIFQHLIIIHFHNTPPYFSLL